MLNKIPTAKEIVKETDQYSHIDDCFDKVFYSGFVESLMIEFAKLHVKAALEAAAENAKVIFVPNCNKHTPYWGACTNCGQYDNSDVPSSDIDSDSILTAYPETKIV